MIARLVKSVLFSICLLALASAASAAALEWTNPAGGQRWAAGSKHALAWKTTDKADAIVALELSRDGGQTWSEIAAAPNTGRYVWTVPEDNETGKTLQFRAGIKGDAAPPAVSKSVATIASQAVPSYRWTEVTQSAPFAPRDGAGALTYAGKLWFLGGWNPGDKKSFPRICNNEVWSSEDGKTWTLVKPNTFLDKNFDPNSDWEGRHTAGYAVYQDKMWIVGGDINQGHHHFDVWNSTDGKTWTQVNIGKPVPWGPRALHYTFVLGGKLWVLGGQTVPSFAPADELFHRDLWNTTDGVNWTKVEIKEPYWPQRGMIGGAAVLNDRVWLLGGGTYDTPKLPTRLFYNDVWSSHDGATWKQHETAPWDPRQYHDVASYDNRLWVMEGYYKANRNDVWYSLDGENWYDIPNTPWAPRHAASVYVHDGALWMVAGNNMRPDVWKLQRAK